MKEGCVRESVKGGVCVRDRDRRDTDTQCTRRSSPSSPLAGPAPQEAVGGPPLLEPPTPPLPFTLIW